MCGVWYCGGDDDCAEGETCGAGACVTKPTTGLVPRILDRPLVLTPGATFTLHVDGVDPANADVAVLVDATFASSNPDVATVDADGKVTGGTSAGTATLTATLDGDDAHAASLVVRNVLVDAAGVNVILVDEATVSALTAGRYVLVNHATGAELVNEVLPTDGVIQYTGDLTDGVDLHVFADDHDWVSWVGIDAARTIYLPIAETHYAKIEMDDVNAIVDTTILDNVGIVRGTPDMSLYPNDQPLEISLTSFALSTALFDFNLQVLLGADVKRYLDPEQSIPQVDPTDPLTVPGGIIFNLGTPAIPSFVLSAPEGTNRLWSLGGRLDLSEVAEYASAIIDSVAGGDLDFTRIVGAVFPLFRSFWSGYDPAVQVDTVGDRTAVIEKSPLLKMPLGLSSSLDIPALPSLGDGIGHADALFFLGGALTADGFMIPLGLNGGADTSDKTKNPPDGIADAIESTPEKDPYVLPLAPLHGGLQSPHTAYIAAIVAVAIPGKDDPRPDSGSAILTRGEIGAGPPAAPELGSFLGFPLDSSWDATSRALVVGSVEGADIQRLLFKGKTGRHWTIWLAGSGSYTVPNPADYFSGEVVDRATDSVELALVNSLDLEDGLGLDVVAAPGGVSLDILLGHVDRISFIDVKDPIPQSTP
ncbi:MAG: Ig-like domain-containing protein [Deltaproteobacteria bacterium]|nr:MAG: Ig-like domain-containing protein [Deltaproteobacteria bacterium]